MRNDDTGGGLAVIFGIWGIFGLMTLMVKLAIFLVFLPFRILIWIAKMMEQHHKFKQECLELNRRGSESFEKVS